MGALIQLTLDGGLVQNSHSVTVRTLSRSMLSIQQSVDRAFLDVHFGQVFKHARLPIKMYPEADFVVGDIVEGSFIIEFLSDTAGPVVKRLIQAITDPYLEAVNEADRQVYSIAHQIEATKGQLQNNIVTPQPYEDFVNAPDPLATRAYGDKSITKNIDYMLSPVKKIEGAYLSLALKPSDEEGTTTFTFTKSTAAAFSRAVSKRQLGAPILIKGSLRALDRGHHKSNFKGKFTNAANNKDLILHIQSEDDLSALIPYLDRDELTIVASPIIEYDSFDPVAGDIQFLEIVE